MSIWFSIIVAGSLFITILLFALFAGLTIPQDSSNGSTVLKIFLVCLFSFLWLVFIFWFWICLVRTAWKWGSEKLGLPVIRILQIAFIIGFIGVAILDVLGSDKPWEVLKVLLGMLLIIDGVIVYIIYNFLLLAWFARCRIPSRAYCEIGACMAMFIIQLWMLKQI